MPGPLSDDIITQDASHNGRKGSFDHGAHYDDAMMLLLPGRGEKSDMESSKCLVCQLEKWSPALELGIPIGLLKS